MNPSPTKLSSNYRFNRLRLGIIASTLATTFGAGYANFVMAAAAENEEALEEVIVTGSRILRRDFEANSPIMTIDEELFENTNTIGIETVMNQLPQFVPAVTQFSTGEVQATATNTPGASTLSLRGLGANRNLVLLDGRRAMPVNASGAVDINMIPSSAIQRVETITGGASSVYGADAMAGVVNFILKKDFEGLDIDMQYGLTEQGDNKSERINGLFGANFLEGRGNVIMGFEYSRRGRVRRQDRDFYTDGWADPTVGGTEPRPSLTSYNSGTYGTPSQAAINTIFNQAPIPVTGAAASFYLNKDGSLWRNQAQGTYRYNGPFFDEQGRQFRKVSDENLIDENTVNSMISIPLERYATFGRAHIEFAENQSMFMQTSFARNHNDTLLAFSPATGSWGSVIPHGPEIWADSLEANGTTNAAYIPGGLYGLNCAATGGCTESQVFPTTPELNALLNSRPEPGNAWRLEHVLDWAGPRRTENTTTTYQIVTGFEGSLPVQDWTYEAYVSLGNTTVQTNFLGFGDLERFRAVVTSPNYGKGFFYTGNSELPFAAGFGGGLGRCTTGLPIMDQFQPSEDCQAAVTSTMQNNSDMEQKVGEFNFQGHIIDLPAGELRFAAGASYRENTYTYKTDILTSQASWLDSAMGVFPASNSNGSIKSRDLYGELLVPVLAGLPFIQELNLELGYRSSYNDPSPDVDTYKALMDWSVNDMIRLRGGWQVANRAPNIGELFLSRTQTLGTTVEGDYCSTRNTVNKFGANPAVNPNAAQVEALCRSLMGVTGATEYYGDINLQGQGGNVSAFTNAVGNPKLKNEEAETFTFGFVLNPFERTTVTMDWYQINIEDMIATQSQGAVYRLCMDPATNPTYNPLHEACSRVVRNPTNGATGPTDVTYTNQSAMTTEGIDMQVNWGMDFLNGGLSASFMVSYLLGVETQVNETASRNDWVGSQGPNDLSGIQGGSYEYRTFTTLSYFDNAGWNASLRWRHLPSIDPAGSVTGTTTLLGPNPYDIFDLSGGYRFGEEENMAIRFGIDNLLDTPPEITGRNTSTLTATSRSSGQGSTSAGFYDVLGRQYYVGLNFNF